MASSCATTTAFPSGAGPARRWGRRASCWGGCRRSGGRYARTRITACGSTRPSSLLRGRSRPEEFADQEILEAVVVLLARREDHDAAQAVRLPAEVARVMR